MLFVSRHAHLFGINTGETLASLKESKLLLSKSDCFSINFQLIVCKFLAWGGYFLVCMHLYECMLFLAFRRKWCRRKLDKLSIKLRESVVEKEGTFVGVRLLEIQSALF